MHGIALSLQYCTAITCAAVVVRPIAHRRVSVAAMKLVGRALGTAAVVAVAACADAASVDRCDREFRARDWAGVIAHCDDPAQVKLAGAWQALTRRSMDEAIAAAEELLGSSVDADAAYLSGYLHGVTGQRETGARRRELLQRARERLLHALEGYRVAGRHADAVRAADFLARVPRDEAHYEDALAYTRVAVEEAVRSGDAATIGRAAITQGEVHDDIGLVHETRAGFLHAEDVLIGIPDLQAFAYLKHGMFLLTLGGVDVHAGLDFLEEARRIARTLSADSTVRSDVEAAVALNRAAALVELDRVDEAEAELRFKAWSTPESAAVRALVAARRGRLDEAATLLREARSGDLPLDLLWPGELELGRAYQRAGRPADAESRFRAAVTDVESERASTDQAELRPWVLARRTAPHLALIAHLIAQPDRALDALTLAESLHARTWLDAVLSDPRRSPTVALRAAEVRNQPAAWPPLDADALLDRLDGREALVLVDAGAHAWRFHVEAGGVTAITLGAAELAVIDQFRRAPADRALAARAAAVLLPATVATRTAPLYLVADGRFADVPFAALSVTDRPLIAARPLARVPGLAALGCRPGDWSDEQVFVGDASSDLPQAAEEVRRLGGPAARIGAAADRAAVLGARRAALLHAAIHGRVTSSGGALVLADGPLTAAEILAAGVAPRTVLLTGCATSASPDAEAWAGFPSAFLAAGSRQVVATARSVPDAGAAELMRAYYATPASAPAALRLAAAQRAVAATATVSVETWAAFAAWGDAACGP